MTIVYIFLAWTQFINMCDLWNEFELKKPPLLTFPIPTKRAPNVRRLQAAIYQYFRQHRPQEVEFAETSALLGRLMARRKNSFHGMMGFRAVVKCNTATCRLLRIDITRELESFQGSLPDFALNSSETLEMPTQNCFDYVLVRLLNVHGIYVRIRECCVQAAEYFAKLMRNNFFMETSTLLLAVLAKLHNLSAVLGNKCVELYNQLQPMRRRFPSAGNSVHLNYELPEQLEAFLENQTLETPKTEGVLLKDDAPLQATHTPLTAVRAMKPVKFKRTSDVGVEVNRECTLTSQIKTFNADVELATIETVKRFIATENVTRKQSLKQSVTKDILPHEWIGATRLFERKLLANEHKKALSIFRKFIVSKVS
ncbi:uncharacterized protein LOC118746737 [Rhagoletis pomonella]|uniref:uncharacterized protein LOC118746737 n=1 Tax=Rhagoletis pomonella TaxID=28610 RepID=UPI001780EEF6|nr:uncharacterized protein LOC118746737 [Rhagoletis pomonella]